ncbi:hypothetical protein AB0H36_10035 [Kribbella sp. NPDC050820]|uniref:hypothetical protein n=1 Tax=Kribbella sp. NPDC050820 TaxID=3155408 RepID=UPI0033C9EC1B
MRRELSVPFETRGHRGLIAIRVVPNDDPWASGHQLVVPDLDAESIRGFPVCTATLRYHGHGINAIMGWVQVITREFDGDVSVDVLPYFAGTPLYSYGHLPTFFDAPANPDHPDGTWRADAFLVIAPDVIRTRTLQPIAAFTWGYRLVGGYPDTLDPARLEHSNWAGHRTVLGRDCPAWSFD